MSSTESASWTPAHSIADKDGASIVKTAEAQVAAKRQLAYQQRVARVQEEALKAGVQTKLEAAQALDPETTDSKRGYFQQRGDLYQDANILSGSANDANERAYKAGKEIKQNDEASIAHLNENLPAYVETATRLANTALASRVGQRALVTSIQDGVVGFTDVKPVDPATQNQDVVLPKAAETAPGQPVK
jgi:hypothetical protein